MVDENEKAEQTQDADSDKESPTLEADVAAKLAAMRGDVEKNDDDTSSEIETEVDMSDKVEPEQTDPEEKETGDDAPILPAGHRRAALGRGWTNEEIDYFISNKPEEAVKKFEEVFNDWQKENSEWSDRGRQLAGIEKKDDDKKETDVLTHVDTKALIEEHGNEELVNALAAPLNATIDRVNAAVEKISSSEKFLQQTEEDALITVVQDFMGSKEMEPFKDVYGVGSKNPTDEQISSQMKLYEQADIIVAGAKDHGKTITPKDALGRALVILSQGSRDEAIRQGIRDSMKKRTKTTKSSHKKTVAPDANEEISEDELVKRTEDRLRKLREK